MTEFFQTIMGRSFYDGTMPKIAEALTILAQYAKECSEETAPKIEVCCVEYDAMLEATLVAPPSSEKPNAFVSRSQAGEAVRALLADSWRWVRTEGPQDDMVAVLERPARATEGKDVEP